MFLYFEEHNLMNRVNRDAYVNNNGKRLFELGKLSDLMIKMSKRLIFTLFYGSSFL